jgi:Nitrous oxide-stimulated promoter
MEPRVVEFVTDKRFVRRRRELRTLEAMIAMYCRRHHGGEALCAECTELGQYARRRLERCVFGDAKPTCANCTVHCYKADMRERVRTMMRWAGPRMLFRHPLIAAMHMIDGRRPAPRLPEAPKARGNRPPD